MQNPQSNRLLSIIIAIIMIAACLVRTPITALKADAVSTDYAAQLVRISTADNSRNLNISGSADKSPCNTWTTNGEQNENWRFDYVGTDSVGSFFKIVNMGTGRLLTPMNYSAKENTPCVIFGSESHTSQHWYVIPVSQDSYGDSLCYKIVNYDDPGLAVTYDSSANTVALSSYSGTENQKWLLNSAGIQGFGGYSKDMNGNSKASVIGGLLGEVVEVTTFDELKAACSDSNPRTIIITKDISGKTSGYEKTLCYDNNYRYICRDDYIYLYPNKTIIGSYNANTLHNVFFRTYDHPDYGEGNNIIIRNINVTHDKELNYDNIWEFSTGWNFWLDHITFVGHDKINDASLGSPDFDKFINFKGDTNFITISDCKIGLGEYGVLLGYPTDTEEIYNQYNGTPCVTLADNYYKDTLTRAPALMRYGYFHSMNNYVLNFDMGYTIHTAAKLYAENCYYEAGTGKGAVVNDDYTSNGQGISSDKAKCYYTDSGSVAVNCYSNNNLTNIKSSPCTWRPSSNYSYAAKTADDAKAYCTAYAGAQSSASAMTYASFSKSGLPSAGYVASPESGWDTEIIPPVEKTAVLDAGKLSTGTFNSAVKANDTFSITANTEKTVTVAEASITSADGKHTINGVIQLGGSGNTGCRSVQINAKQPGTVNVYMMSSNPEINRTVNLIDTDGNIVSSMENVTGTELGKYSYSIPAQGTYYLTSASSGLNVYYAELDYSAINYTSGDLNCDGRVDSFDLVIMRKVVTNNEWGSAEIKAAADVNGDNVADSKDMQLLRDFLLGIDVKFAPYKAPQSAGNKYEPDGFKFSGNVYLVGDSTVCEYDSQMSSDYNRYGWGMKLSEEFNNVNVNNLALSGRSSRSFLTEANYKTLTENISSGDYLIIQFGHNDEKTDEATYPGLGTYPGLDMSTLDSNGKNNNNQYSYEWILLNKYIKMAQGKGAVPVLITPITRRASDGTANYNQHTPYQQALLSLSQQYNIPVVDMTSITAELYTNLYNSGGADATAAMHCYADAAHTSIDNTHLSNAGAQKIAGIIADELKNLGLSLSKYVK